jgi:pyrophosphatase PpaX
MRFPFVLFDLDGTVIDSGPMILASFRHATRVVLGRELSDERLLAGVGGSTLDEQMRVLDATRGDELVAAYRLHNEPLHLGLKACAGMEETLRRLHEEGRRLGVVTAKRHATIDLAFERVPLGGLFDVVIGSDDVARGKPHPDGILLALERLGGTPEEAAYVGDSPYDIGAATAAGVHSVAVTWGGIHPRGALEAAGPDSVVNTAGELLAIL